jgi:hypothetical protein
MIQCPSCSSQLSTSGSYRVHKHRFHRVNSVDNHAVELTVEHTDNAVIEHAVNSSIALQDNSANDADNNIAEIIKQASNTPATTYLGTDKATSRTANTDDGNLALILGLGAIALAVIVKYLTKKQ